MRIYRKTATFNVAGEAEELYQAEVQERSYEDIEYLPAEGELC